MSSRATPPGSGEPAGEQPEGRPGESPRRFDWRSVEAAWPLSLLAGFGGAWLGMQTSLPGVPALLAAALFAPLWVAQLARSRRLRAALIAFGWAIGIAAATIGTTLEGGRDKVLAANPGAERFAASEVRPWLGAGPAERAVARPLDELPSERTPAGVAFEASDLARSLAAIAVVALFAPLALGLPSLVVVALAVGVLASGAGQVAERRVAEGSDPLAASLVGFAPHVAVLLAGALLLAAALGEPGALWPPRWIHPERRRALAAGAGAVLLGLALQPVSQRVWAGWLAS